jgi:hypothetical protein
LWTDSSELRPSNQYIFLNLMLSSSRFFLICSFHRNLASTGILSCFAVLTYGTCVPLMKVGCCLIFLFVKSICTNLNSLSVIRHLFLFRQRLLAYKYPDRTSQETYYVSATEPSQLMLCKIWGFHGADYEECRLLAYKNPVRSSQETHYVSATELSRLMLCWL